MKPKKYVGETAPVGFRLPVQLIERVDTFCAHVAQQSGFSPSRTDAIRMLLEKALTAEGFPPAETKGKAKR